MIASMTGFGRGESSDGGYVVTAEIKSLNSRYLDISLKLPPSLQEKEFELKSLVQNSMSRGKLLINLNLEMTETELPRIRYRPELVKSYSKMLDEIRFHAGISQPLMLKDLLSFQDIWVSKEADATDLEVIWSCAQKAVTEAVAQLQEMRQKEGNELMTDLLKQLDDIDQLIVKVQKLAEQRIPELRDRFRARVDRLMNDKTRDDARIEMEIVLLADKMDVNEEIVRMQSHGKFFREALRSGDPVGRRLNFLCQEMNRELNTIGSKASDSEIAQDMVVAKEKLEQIREQVQNIE